MAKRHSTDLATRSQSNLPARVLADRVVAKLREAEKALQYATTVHQAKLVSDVAAAQEVFAHRQRLGDEVEGYAHQIKIYALAKLGELVRDMPKATNTSGLRRGSVGARPVPTEKQTYKDLGLSKKTASVSQQLAALSVPIRDAIASRETTLREAIQPQRKQERVDKIVDIAKGNVALDVAVRYPVIYADPPWRYEHVKTESRAIENQYPTMDLAEICALPVSDLATPDAVLFLWATSPKLSESMRVIEAWGFTYRTCAVWVKDKIGMGYYFRQRHELLLVATRGAVPVPDTDKRPDSVFEAPRDKHSEKPAACAEAIERMYPEFSKIEMFCRSPRKGWAAWGNQAVA